MQFGDRVPQNAVQTHDDLDCARVIAGDAVWRVLK